LRLGAPWQAPGSVMWRNERMTEVHGVPGGWRAGRRSGTDVNISGAACERHALRSYKHSRAKADLALDIGIIIRRRMLRRPWLCL
jgi:hypothetical protein